MFQTSKCDSSGSFIVMLSCSCILRLRGKGPIMDALVWRSLTAVGRCASFLVKLRLVFSIEAFQVPASLLSLSLLPVSLSFAGGIVWRPTEWRSYDLDTAFRTTLRSSGLALAARDARLKAPQKECSVLSCTMGTDAACPQLSFSILITEMLRACLIAPLRRA